jgi:hypothetical protein
MFLPRHVQLATPALLGAGSMLKRRDGDSALTLKTAKPMSLDMILMACWLG